MEHIAQYDNATIDALIDTKYSNQKIQIYTSKQASPEGEVSEFIPICAYLICKLPFEC